MAGKKPAPKSGEQLRKEAQARLKKANIEQYLPYDQEERVAALGELSDMDFTTFTRAELQHLQGLVRVLYDDACSELQAIKDAEEPLCPASRTAIGVADALERGIQPAEGQMTPEAWAKEHRLNPVTGNRKRGPAPHRKKTIWDLSPSKDNGLLTKEQHNKRVKQRMPWETEEAALVRLEIEAQLEKTLEENKLPILKGKRIQERPAKRSDFNNISRK